MFPDLTFFLSQLFVYLFANIFLFCIRCLTTRHCVVELWRGGGLLFLGLWAAQAKLVLLSRTFRGPNPIARILGLFRKFHGKNFFLAFFISELNVSKMLWYFWQIFCTQFVKMNGKKEIIFVNFSVLCAHFRTEQENERPVGAQHLLLVVVDKVPHPSPLFSHATHTISSLVGSYCHFFSCIISLFLSSHYSLSCCLLSLFFYLLLMNYSSLIFFYFPSFHSLMFNHF